LAFLHIPDLLICRQRNADEWFEMKKCLYCGAENPDDAAHCSSCGQSEFAEGLSEGTKQLYIVRRISLGAVVWSIITGISLYVGWQNACDSPAARLEQYQTQRRLKEIATAVSEYRQTYAANPTSANDLAKMTNHAFEGNMLDGWGRALLFTVDRSNLVATSYGRDGRSGGVGLDCDLTSTNWTSKEAKPTFKQFLYAMPTGGMVTSAAVSGAFGFLIAVFVIKSEDFGGDNFLPFIGKLAAILICAIFIAVVITVLHVPSGH
jgi:ribosomal protein L40E